MVVPPSPPSRHTSYKRYAVVSGVAIAAAVAGCGSSSTGASTKNKPGGGSSSSAPAAVKSLAITVAKDSTVSGLPATLTAGTYKVSATSPSATTAVSVQLARLSPGFTQAQLLADVSKGLMAQTPDKAAVAETYAKATFVGGPAGAGKSAATVFLPAGDYIYLDTDSQAQPKVGTLKVTAGESKPAMPATDITVDGKGDEKGMFTFDVTGSLSKSGTLTFKNTSEDNAHFVSIAKLKPGKTKADALAFQGDPSDPKSPIIDVLDTTIISPASAQVVDFTSQGPGTYLLVCFLPDPKTGAPHAMEGMVKEVQAS